MTYGVYQISSGETISVRSAAEFVAAELEGVKVVEDTGRERMEPVLSNQRFAEEFGIRIVHKPETEIGRRRRTSGSTHLLLCGHRAEKRDGAGSESGRERP